MTSAGPAALPAGADVGVSAETSGTARTAWFDVAKALAISLVVLHHACTATVTYLAPGRDNVVLDALTAVSAALLPVRMPLFFLVSGLLAARALARPWHAVVRRRVLHLVWPFLLWSGPLALVVALARDPARPWSGFWAVLADVAALGGGYWYLPALAVFFCAARLLRERRRWAQGVSLAVLLAAPLLAAWSEDWLPEPLGATLVRWSLTAFWFMAGCFGGAVVARATSLPRVATVLVGGTAYLAGTLLLGSDAGTSPWRPALTVVGLVTMIAVSSRLGDARGGRYGRVARSVAARTLPVYLLHPLLIHLVVLAAHLGAGGTAPDPVVTLCVALTVPLLTALGLVVPLWLADRALPRVPWLLVPPRARERASPSPATRRRG